MQKSAGCDGCRNAEAFPIDFTMAFQPIVDVGSGLIWGYEALVRGKDGQGAAAVLAAVDDTNRYTFDQACRVKAIELAGSRMPAGSEARLSINFMPSAVYEPSACIRSSLAAAARAKFNPRRLMFEFTENERVDTAHVKKIIAAYKQMGFITAVDDFGAGYAGLNLLAEFQPDLIKIDMELIRNIDNSTARRALLRGIVQIAADLQLQVLAEGLETAAEVEIVSSAGVRLLQGYFFAKPKLETFDTETDIPALNAFRAAAWAKGLARPQRLRP